MSDIVERLQQLSYVSPPRDQKDYSCMVSKDVLAEAAAEIERLRAALEWRPIETAPKDGKDILGVTEHGVVIIHWMAENYFGTGEAARWFPSNRPTHWLPLPSPPEAKP